MHAGRRGGAAVILSQIAGVLAVFAGQGISVPSALHRRALVPLFEHVEERTPFVLEEPEI